MCNRNAHPRRLSSAYLICRPDIRQHAARADWSDTHPKGVFVRQDDLSALTHDFCTDHGLGPRRQEAMRSPATPATPVADPAVAREGEIADLAKRRRNILDQIEEYEPSGDDDLDRTCRTDLRERLAEIVRRTNAKTSQLASLAAPTQQAGDDPTILDQLPPTTIDLAAVPEDLRRSLYDSFNLELRYHGPERAVTIRVTVRHDRVPDIRAAIEQADTGPPPGGTHGGRSLVLGARGGVRTRTPVRAMDFESIMSASSITRARAPTAYSGGVRRLVLVGVVVLGVKALLAYREQRLAEGEAQLGVTSR